MTPPTDAGPATGRSANDGTMKATERVADGGSGPGRGTGQIGQKPMRFAASARRLLRCLRPYRAGVIGVLVAAIFSIALSTAGPKVLGKATDIILAGVVGGNLPAGTTKAEAIAATRAAGHPRIAELMRGIDLVPGQGIDFTALGHTLLLVIALYAGAAVLGFLQGYLLNEVVQKTIFRLRADVEDKLNRLPLRYFDRQPRGELLSRVTNDIDNVSQSLQQTVSRLLASAVTVAFVVAMMLYISVTLALIALATIPVTMIVAGMVMKRSQAQFIAQWRRTGSLNGHVEEAFTGHSLIKIFGRRRQAQSTFDEHNEALYRASFTAQFLSGLIMPVIMFVANLNFVAIAVVGGLRVATGTMSLGDVQAFIQYSSRFAHPVTQMASMINLLQSGVASAERVFELIDADDEVDDRHNPPLEAAVHGRVTFENVSFRYAPDEPLIENLSLTVEPGHTVAIVGPTGAGKTTLVNLIMRFYELDGGRILLDGMDIAHLRRAELRAQIGMVLQDTWLFKGTIRDNIAYGNPNAGEDDILAAARATFVDRFVHSLPDGYDTVIDDEASNISAGEKQLITIARAFLAQPALLILDEATSSVDTRTELLLQNAMAALRSGRTSFVIAHRLSTITGADTILVMDAGRIVEHGSHRELIAKGGVYASLYRAQFAGPGADVPAA